MAAYFVRLLIKGIINFFLSGLIIFTLVTYMPGGSVDTVRSFSSAGVGDRYSDDLYALYHLDKPWPTNYLSYLFNPDATTWEEVPSDLIPSIMVNREVPKSIDIDAISLHLHGSGILTGDFGESTHFARGTPVLTIFGPGFGELMLLSILTIPLSMAFVLIKRRGRPSMYEIPYIPARP